MNESVAQIPDASVEGSAGMESFTAHRLLVRATVTAPLALNEHKGSALRGALYHGLRRRFCALRTEMEECAGCPLWEACPVCTLVSTLDPANRLGRDACRPYTIQPPLDGGRTHYEAGEPFVFGLTLYGEVVRYFPYLAMAMDALAEDGLGRRISPDGRAVSARRGTLRIEEIWAENPLAGQRARLLAQGEYAVAMPEIPITHAQVCAEAERRCSVAANGSGPTGRGCWTLELLTPMRLTYRGGLVKPGELRFPILLARLFDRLESLAESFCATPLRLDYSALLQAAEAVQVEADDTRWVELDSFSTRQRRATPIGGLVGRATLAAEDWAPFMPWLIWGEYVQVGKDAVKGNGWYRLRPGSVRR